ncbi:alpha/beta fold hydrolase [Desertivirga brevis]|uniref:alpha/beta fold hydrolase n=1 Tax=Desertivirga brevis TaxID=2810310 RepID=UPI001A95C235|nr:alpha/beta hydrolase [Pedobacter sp. SYSU D00873]
MIEEKSVKIDDREVFYLKRTGVSPKTTLIFIHGFPFSSSMWKPQLEVLPEGIEAYAPDIRGFGKSTTPHSFFSVDLFARDLFAFLDTLQLGQVVLCGLSMGGYISLRAAEIDRSRIKGIVLCDTNCVADTNESKLKRFSTIDLVASGRKNEFAESFLKNLFAESSFEKKDPGIELIRSIILSTAGSTICGSQLALASRTDTSAVLGEIAVPALVIRGEYDQVMTPAQAIQLQQGIRRSELITVPSAGHMSNIENPEVFNDALLNFLAKHFS